MSHPLRTVGGVSVVILVVGVLAVSGLAAVVVAVVGVARWQRRLAGEVADLVRASAADEREAAIRAAADQAAAVAAADLEARKALIDERLNLLGGQLTHLADTVERLRRERAGAEGELRSQLEATLAATGELTRTAGALQRVLSNPTARGQWGERVLDDILRLSGLREGVSYVRQRTLPGGARPDVTFLLPGDRMLHLDAKFPLSNYARMIESDGAEADQARRQFLKDVRARIRDLARRDGYIDPASGTVDYVLMFVPNEAVYRFLHEEDPGLVDEALRLKVVCCSPHTLFAVLAVIRQAVETFALEQTTSEILEVLGSFQDEWTRFCDQMDKVGRRIDQLGTDFEQLSGTRRRQLERPLRRIAELREGRADRAEGAPAPGRDLNVA